MIFTTILGLVEDTLFNWLSNNMPTIGGFILAMWFTWWIRGVLIGYQDRLTGVEVECKQLSIRIDDVEAKLSIRIDDVEAKLSRRIDDVEAKLTRRIDDVETKLTNMIHDLDTKLTNLIYYVHSKLKEVTGELTDKNVISTNILSSMSPLALNEAGIRLMKESGAKQYIDDNLERLINRIKEQNFKNSYDLQIYCFQVFSFDISEEDDLSAIKEYVFNTPTLKITEEHSVPLTWGDLYGGMAIYLRDRYFEVYPELWEKSRLWREEHQKKMAELQQSAS